MIRLGQLFASLNRNCVAQLLCSDSGVVLAPDRTSVNSLPIELQLSIKFEKQVDLN